MNELNRAAGVGYKALDAFKQYAQTAARSTHDRLNSFGFSEAARSRGETAYVVDVGDFCIAFTPEGLGTKNLAIADIASESSGFERGYYTAGWDSVAMIANDLVAVGAQPAVISPHWGLGNSEWLTDTERSQALVDGWKDACIASGAVYGAGETAELRGIIYPNTVELSGAGWGIIRPKNRLTLGNKLKAGDHIILIESSGIHANGITTVREQIVSRLPRGYLTPLPSGGTLAGALLKRTHIYAGLARALFEQRVDLHYQTHISGHGWRKLMRAQMDFTYRLHAIPPVPEEFRLIADVGKFTHEQMYAAFNMGAGFAFYVPGEQATLAQEIARNLGYQSWDAGVVEEGPKQVVIEPNGITYRQDSLQIR